MGTSQERRPCRVSNATRTGPLSEAMPACRGRRADHAQKDRVGTWEIPRSARAIPLLVRIGKGKPIADDERTREVGPSSSSCEAGEQGGAIRRGAGGAKGWDQGECKPATLGPDAEPGNRVTGAGAHTSNRKGKEEGTVHSALPPYQRRTAPGCVLCHQAGGSPRRRRGDMAELRGKRGDKPPGFARACSTGSVSGTAVPATVHTQAGWRAAPARGRRPGRQDGPTGDGDTAQRDLRGGLPRFLVRVPARTQRASCDGCARGRNREQEGELDTGRRYPIILRFDQPGMAGPLPGTSDRRPAPPSPDPEMAQGGRT